MFLSLQKHIPIKTNKYRKYYTTRISVETLHKYKGKIIILGVHNLDRNSEIRTIVYAPNSIYISNANIQPTQEKLAYAYKTIINFIISKKDEKAEKKSPKNNPAINSFYFANNELYGIQTIHSNKAKSFVTKVYKYSTEADKWKLYAELKHEIDKENTEEIGVIIHTADLIGPYIIRAEIIMHKHFIQKLLSDLKKKSREDIENGEYELEITARVIVIDISTLRYVTALKHTFYIKEKLKWLNKIISSYGTDKEETYIKIIKDSKKIPIDDIFRLYIKSIRLKYSYIEGNYNYNNNEFSNLSIEPILIIENEIEPIGHIVLKKALDLGFDKIETMIQISNVLATNRIMIVENKHKNSKIYFYNPKLKGFSNDGRIFCYYAIIEKTNDDEKIRIPVTIIHAWDDKLNSFYQYVYDKDAARSVIAYIEDKHTKKTVGVVFSTYKEGYIVIALIDTKNNAIIVQEFAKNYQSLVYTNLSNIVRMLCGKRYTVNNPSIGEFEYYIKKGEVITPFKVIRPYDKVEVNYWNGLCKRYIVISDYPKQQCSIYMPNIKGVIKEDNFTFLHDELEMQILGTRRFIKRENNTCIFFELQNPVLVVRGPEFSNF